MIDGDARSKRRGISPAVIEFDASDQEPARAPMYNDVYCARSGALEHAQAVFLAGNGLPTRWQGRDRFVVLETGFGLGGNFIATLQAWRADPQRSKHLHYLAVDRHPPSRVDLAKAWQRLLHTPSPQSEDTALQGIEPARATPQEDLQQLIDGWPPCMPGVHLLTFAHGRVHLQLAWSDVQLAMREWVACVDAFMLDGFTPSHNPDMWSVEVFRGVGRLAAPDATVAMWNTAPKVHEGLKLAGFASERFPGVESKRHGLRASKVPMKAVYDTQALCGPRVSPAPTDVLVIGAGLAGAHVVQSLTARGVRCVVMEADRDIAMGASSGRGGIFHATVHRDDTVHARVLRAAALWASRSHANALAAGVDGNVDGHLRLERAPDSPPSSAESTDRHASAHEDWPAEWARKVQGEELAQLSGLAAMRSSGNTRGWWFAQGGWIDPQGLARHLLEQAARVQFNTRVSRLERDGNATTVWIARDAQGHELGRWPCVVLANAFDAAQLCTWAAWPLSRVRGQSETLPPGSVWPALKASVSGDGYALPLRDGGIVFGATSQPEDLDAGSRASDTQSNVERLRRLIGAGMVNDASPVSRVGWRVSTPDRLPLVGSVPSIDWRASKDTRAPPTRHWPREQGLYVATAFGSRGLTMAPLAGELIAAAIFREPLPLEASLVAALDPARFVAHAAQGLKVRQRNS